MKTDPFNIYGGVPTSSEPPPPPRHRHKLYIHGQRSARRRRQVLFPEYAIFTDVACGAGHCLALGRHAHGPCSGRDSWSSDAVTVVASGTASPNATVVYRWGFIHVNGKRATLRRGQGRAVFNCGMEVRWRHTAPKLAATASSSFSCIVRHRCPVTPGQWGSLPAVSWTLCHLLRQ